MAELILGSSAAPAWSTAAGIPAAGGAPAALSGAASGALFNPWGLAVTAGLFLLSYLTQKKQRIEGPRIEDLSVMSAREGTAENICIGPVSRVGGTLIWTSDLIEVKTREDGGKGGRGVEYIVYQYFAHLAVAVCRGPIDRITEIWADGKKIYTAQLDPDITVTALPIENPGNLASGFSAFWKWTHSWFYGTSGGNGYALIQSRMTLRFDPDQTVLLSLQEGNDVEISGVDPDLLGPGVSINGTYKLIARGYEQLEGAPPGKYAAIYLELDWGDFTYGPVQKYSTVPDQAPWWYAPRTDNITLTLKQAQGVFGGNIAAAMRTYNGTEDQFPDPLIESYEGSGSVPAFRGMSYVVFESLRLTDFGNRIPTFEFQVQNGGEDFTVGDAIAQAIDYGGGLQPLGKYAIDAGLYDEPFQGMSVSGVQSSADLLAPIVAAYDVVTYQDGDTQRFNLHTALTSRTVSADDLPGAPADQVTVEHTSEVDLPTEVVVRYLDPEKEYQSGSRRASLSTASARAIQTVDLPIVMSGQKASEIANRILWETRQTRRRMSTALPPSYIDVKAGTLLTVPALEDSWTVLVSQADLGANLVSEVSGPVEDLEVLDQSAVAINDDPADAPGDIPEDSGSYPPELVYEAIDIAPLRDQDANVPGVYFAACRASTTKRWRGATIYESSDSGRRYRPIGYIEQEATIGVVTASSYGGATHRMVDRGSYIDVEMIAGELESVQTETMLAGHNVFYCNGEVFGAATVYPLSRRRYRLYNLLRGMRGTESAIAAHPRGSLLVALTAPVHFQELNFAAFRTARQYKIVPFGHTPDLVAPMTAVWEGCTMMPPTPYQIRGVRDGSNNLDITWLPRSRGIARATQGRYLGEESERYMVEVYDGSDVVRTSRISGARAATYTAAEQTADGLAPGDPVTLTVTQLSDTVGRGRPRKATV